jgi:hypothetical protein
MLGISSASDGSLEGMESYRHFESCHFFKLSHKIFKYVEKLNAITLL